MTYLTRVESAEISESQDEFKKRVLDVLGIVARANHSLICVGCGYGGSYR